MIEGLEERMSILVLQESATAAIEEWADFLNRLDVPFFNYRGTHVTEVVRIAKYLARETGADYDVVVMAAWFHDVSKPTTIGGNSIHGTDSANIAREFLLNEGVNEKAVVRVCDAIEKHLGYTSDDEYYTLDDASSIEAQVIWDADKLTKLGITSMIFHLINGLRYEPNPNMEGILERLRKSLPGLRKIVTSMNTEPGRRIANARMKNYESVINLLESELSIEQ